MDWGPDAGALMECSDNIVATGSLAVKGFV
jgi:hypothetical protein